MIKQSRADTEGTVFEFDDYLEVQGLHLHKFGHLLANPRQFNDIMDQRDAIQEWAEFLDSISLKDQWTLVIAQTRKRFDQAVVKVRELLDL